MAAKKKPVQTLSLADLGLDAGAVGLANATSEVVEFDRRGRRGRPARSSRTRATAA